MRRNIECACSLLTISPCNVPHAFNQNCICVLNVLAYNVVNVLACDVLTVFACDVVNVLAHNLLNVLTSDVVRHKHVILPAWKCIFVQHPSD